MKDKRFDRFLISACGVLVLLLTLGGHMLTISDKKEAGPRSYPRISTEEELKQALYRHSQPYLLTDIPLYGQAVSDPMQLLQGEYLQLEYSCEQYRQETETDSDGYTHTVLRWCPHDVLCQAVQSPQVLLFGSVPMDASGCEYQNDYYLPLDGSNCLPEKLPLLEKDHYYPNGVAEVPGTLRYRACGIPVGAKVAFLAVIGGGQLSVLPAREDMYPLVVDGDVDDLMYYVSEGETGVFVLLWLLLFPLDVYLWYRVIRLRRSLRKEQARQN